eukprot:9832124-Lingulodinium_polyedra.AAC.1
MEWPRTVHGQSMDCPWTGDGNPWIARILSVGSSWTIKGQSMDCPSAVHGLAMDIPWVVDWQPMD